MGEVQAIKTRGVAGGAAGNLTVTGIKVGDKLIAVVDTETAGANLASEFAITADDTVNNAGGTDTTGMDLLFVWESFQGGRWSTDRMAGGLGRVGY